MAVASTNPFPYVTMVESASPGNPASGRQLLFLDSGDGDLHLRDSGGAEYRIYTSVSAPVEIGVACSDESTAIAATGTKTTFRMPYAMTVTGVRASLTGATTTGTFTVDINEAGVSILSTKLTIDAAEKTSTTAVAAAVISDSALADDAEVTVDVDVVGDGTATGLKVWILGTRT